MKVNGKDNMAVLFLTIIYVTFISLGLPDALLGVGWPEMHVEFGVSQSLAGVVSMTISVGTIVSSFFSGKLIRRFGTGKLTAFSVLATAGGLLAFSAAPHFIWLLVAAIPLGLGAGAVDAGLNDYVARHYEAHHMNWLHSFWGVGALTSPLIMSYVLTQNDSWRKGYLIVSIIQFVLVLILFLTLPMWRKRESRLSVQATPEESTLEEVRFFQFIQSKKVRAALYGFFLYIGVEATVGLWSSSYLIQAKGIDSAKAALAVSGFFGFIMFGRLISGFVSMRLTNRQLIRYGQFLIIAGGLILFISTSYPFLLIGICFVGFGCAPIFPAMLHDTPRRFGKAVGQQIMGVQMAVSYIGSVLLSPLFGFVSTKIGIGTLPLFIILFSVCMYIASESLNKKVDQEDLRG